MGISSVTFSGPGAAAFSIAGAVGTYMVPGASYAYQVWFGPSAVGPFSATLSVNDEASNSPQTISLSGIGTTDTCLNCVATSPVVAAWGSKAKVPQQVYGNLDGNMAGTVTFTFGGKTLGTVPVIDRTATLDVDIGAASGFVIGANYIQTSYSGDQYFWPSDGGQIEVDVVAKAGLPMLSSFQWSDYAWVSNTDALLEVVGYNFTPESKVLWNGLLLPTLYVSGGLLNATIPAEYVAKECVAWVSVANPAGRSAALPYLVTSAAPGVIRRVSLSSAKDASGNYQLGIAGDGFAFAVGADYVTWNGSDLPFSPSGDWGASAEVSSSQEPDRPAKVATGYTGAGGASTPPFLFH